MQSTSSSSSSRRFYRTPVVQRIGGGRPPFPPYKLEMFDQMFRVKKTLLMPKEFLFAIDPSPTKKDPKPEPIFPENDNQPSFKPSSKTAQLGFHIPAFKKLPSAIHHHILTFFTGAQVHYLTDAGTSSFSDYTNYFATTCIYNSHTIYRWSLNPCSVLGTWSKNPYFIPGHAFNFVAPYNHNHSVMMNVSPEGEVVGQIDTEKVVHALALEKIKSCFSVKFIPYSFEEKDSAKLEVQVDKIKDLKFRDEIKFDFKPTQFKFSKLIAAIHEPLDSDFTKEFRTHYKPGIFGGRVGRLLKSNKPFSKEIAIAMAQKKPHSATAKALKKMGINF